MEFREVTGFAQGHMGSGSSSRLQSKAAFMCSAASWLGPCLTSHSFMHVFIQCIIYRPFVPGPVKDTTLRKLNWKKKQPGKQMWIMEGPVKDAGKFNRRGRAL